MSDPTTTFRSGLVDPGNLDRLDETPRPQTRPEAPKPKPYTGTMSPYAKKVLDGECSKLASCQPGGGDGGRWRKIFAVTARLGELVAGGLLPRDLVVSQALDAAAACGAVEAYGENKVMEQIEDGLLKGASNPCYGPPSDTRTKPSAAPVSNTPSTKDVTEEPEGFVDDQDPVMSGDAFTADQEAAMPIIEEHKRRQSQQQTYGDWKKSTFENINDPDAGKVDYLIDGLIPRGDVTIIAATWKTGKTLAFYHLVLAALSARRVFGRFEIPAPIKTCVFQLEMPEREDTRRHRRLSLGLGMMPEEVPAFATAGDFTHYNRPLGFTLCTPEGVKAFEDAVIASGAQLVIIDSLIKAFAGEDIDKNTVVAKLFAAAFAKLTSQGITIILLHHKRKTPAGFRVGQDDEKSSMLGAQAWGAAAGRVFTLDRLPKKGEQVGADGEPPDSTSFCVRLAVSGSWTPEEACEMVLEVADKGEATTVTALDEVAQATSKVLTKIQRGALALARLVRERVSIGMPSALILVSAEKNISMRTLRDSVPYAKERGWIDSHDTPGGKNNEQTLTPGPAIEEAL